MSKTSPYELRFQMFDTARSVLVDQYFADKEKRERLLDEKIGLSNLPEYPEYPTLADVMLMAQQINEFVSKP